MLATLTTSELTGKCSTSSTGRGAEGEGERSWVCRISKAINSWIVSVISSSGKCAARVDVSSSWVACGCACAYSRTACETGSMTNMDILLAATRMFWSPCVIAWAFSARKCNSIMPSQNPYLYPLPCYSIGGKINLAGITNKWARAPMGRFAPSGVYQASTQTSPTLPSIKCRLGFGPSSLG